MFVPDGIYLQRIGQVVEECRPITCRIFSPDQIQYDAILVYYLPYSSCILAWGMIEWKRRIGTNCKFRFYYTWLVSHRPIPDL